MGLKPKSTANLCHPGHLKTLRRAATSQMYERSFIVAFDRDLSYALSIFSINKVIWPIGTFEVTALAFVAFEPVFSLSPGVARYKCNWYFPVGSPSLFSNYFQFACTHEFPPSVRVHCHSRRHPCRHHHASLSLLSITLITFPKKKGKPWLSSSSFAYNATIEFFLISS